jgi:predicted nucleic-acid-binding protein
MIGLDTNILVRYFAQDDPAQSRQAADIVERRLTEDEPGFVCIVTMVEVAWVLDRIYGLGADAIAGAVGRMLQAETLEIENEQEVFRAMIALREERLPFADSLISALGAKAGCAFTLTFDRKALRIPGFRLP